MKKENNETEVCHKSELMRLLGTRTHHLKTLPDYFEQLWHECKNFEVRKNDRAFQKGDSVILREFDPAKHTIEKYKYTGRYIFAKIGFVLSEYQKEGYVTFSLVDIEKCNESDNILDECT